MDEENLDNIVGGNTAAVISSENIEERSSTSSDRVDSRHSGSVDSSDACSDGSHDELKLCNLSNMDSDVSENGSEGYEDSGDMPAMLHEGSFKTLEETVLAIMELYIGERWTKTSLKKVLKFCHEFFPSDLPKTVHMLFKYVEDHTPDNYYEIKHFYCSQCRHLKETSSVPCQHCRATSTSAFFELPISAQLKHFFEFRDLASHLESPNPTVVDCDIISDIRDGSEYRRLKEYINGKYDLTILWNTDGVSLVGSSRSTMWPLLGTICEVPPRLRTSYMIVCGIWYDLKGKPVMNEFLKLFVNSLKRLYEEGVVWTHPRTKEEIKSIVLAPVLCADAPARADVLVMQHFMGKYGCNSCEQKSIRINRTPDEISKHKVQKLRRLVYQENPACLRSQERMDSQSLKAERLGKSVKGVQGSAVVSQIPHFDRGTSAVPEYMHCVLLGVVGLLVRLWFFTKGPWYIGDRVQEVNIFIQEKVKVPDHITRIPRGIAEVKFWKASEFRAWLLFYSLPALQGILPNMYLQHYMLLVSAVFLLLKDKLTPHDITNADAMLRLFVRDIALHYRLRDYVYNVHNLLHLPMYVKRWGPMWATSAFIFENFNHLLAGLTHGTKHKGQEMVNRIRLAHGVQILKSKVMNGTSHACNSNTNGVLGSSVDVDAEPSIICSYLPANVKAYIRSRYNGEIFTTQNYDKSKKRANSYVYFKTNDETAYGQVLYFFETDGEVISLIRKYQVQQIDIFFHIQSRIKITHLIPFKETSDVAVVPLKSLTKVAMAGNFLCLRPNSLERNL